MNVNEKTMGEINQVQLLMYKQFLVICQELKLKHYLIHGSLLGAVLLQRPFPEDDDIDIAMPRHDYEKFLTKAREFLPEYYFLQTHTTDIEFPLGMAKMRDSRTTYVQDNMRKLNINHGIYIDIFPIDKYISNSFYRYILYLELRLINIRVTDALILEKNTQLRKIALFVSKIIWKDKKKAYERRETIYKKGNSNKYMSIYGSKKKDLKIPRDWFGDGVGLKFDDCISSIPCQACLYLAHIYGDYKNYSPVYEHRNEDGSISTNAILINTKTSYRDLRW